MIRLVGRVDNPYRHRDSNTPPLAVGMFVTAEILGHHSENVVVIRVLHSAEKSRPRGPGNRLYYRTIDILRADSEKVVVKSGLKSGDQLCLSPIDTVVDGMRVRTVRTGGHNEKCH